jgi:hypothetical protein
MGSFSALQSAGRAEEENPLRRRGDRMKNGVGKLPGLREMTEAVQERSGDGATKETELLLTGYFENLWQGAAISIMTLFDITGRAETKATEEALKKKRGGEHC